MVLLLNASLPSPPKGPMQSKSTKSWILLWLLSLLWGFSFLWIRLAVQDVPPLFLAALRVSFGGALLWFFFCILQAKSQRFSIKLWLYAGLMGFLGNALPFTAINWGLQKADSAQAGILMATMPITTALLAHFFANETLNLKRILGLSFGFIGVLFIFWPDVDQGAGKGLFWHKGAILGAALCYAVNAIIAKKAPEAPQYFWAYATLCWAGVFALPLAFSFESINPGTWTPLTWVALTALTVLSTSAGTVVYFALIKEAGASFMAMINFPIPIIATAAGILFLDEPFSIFLFSALGFVLLGLYFAQPQPNNEQLN